jgi:hypothetical protein
MGGVVDAIGDVVGGAADVVGDVAGGAIDIVGDVVETVVDNPELALIGGIFAAPYLAPELFFGGAASAGGVGAGLIAPEVAGLASSLGGLGTSAGLGGLGAGLIAPEIAALGTYFGANSLPSLDFISSFIPKTPADIAKTLGQAALLGGAAAVPQPQVPEVDMNIPGSNVPQYGTGRSILNAYNNSKQNINNILYPQGLLGTQQPRTAGIYSDYLQQQGLI